MVMSPSLADRPSMLAVNHGRQLECDFRGLILEREDQL